MHEQPPANGQVTATVGTFQEDRDAMVSAKFMVDTAHPLYGEIEKGEVLSVTREYLDHYITLGVAVETDEELSRDPIEEE